MRALFIILLAVTACNSGETKLPGFNESVWKKDKGGCNGKRQEMQASLETSLDALKGLSENEILEVLGSPDLNELYKRNQKFYIYHITPATDCGPRNAKSHLFLEIRFSATNMAREVMIKESGE